MRELVEKGEERGRAESRKREKRGEGVREEEEREGEKYIFLRLYRWRG